MISIDRGLCSGCNRCVEVCGVNFTAEPGGKPKVCDPPAFCLACGHCVAVCPRKAISHDGLGELRAGPLGPRPDFASLMNLLKARRSRREFTEQGLGQGEIDSLLEAAAQAPNGLNRRNVHFAVVTDRSALRELSSRIGRQAAWLSRRLESPAWRLVFKLLLGGQYREIEPLIPLLGPMAEATMKGRDMVLYNAPCAILIHTGRGDPCGAEDSVYCGANILLAAEALGLGACVVGFLTEPVNRSRDLARLAGIPRGHKVHTSIVAGRPRFPYARAISRPVFNPSR